MNTNSETAEKQPSFPRNFHWRHGSADPSPEPTSSSEPSTSSGPTSVEPECDELAIDWPLSVFDQAVKEHARNPSNNTLLMGRLFGSPTNSNEPCRTCCGLNIQIDKKVWKTKNKKEKKKYMGYTEEEFENMRDTCPAHYVNTVLKERAEAEAVNGARAAKEREKEMRRADAEAKKRLKREREKAKKKAEKVAAKQAQAASKGKASTSKKEEYEDESESESSESEREPTPPPRKKKKRNVWNCPNCNRSSRFGSAGCCQCDEWYHLQCIGYRSGKEVPKGWICDLCKVTWG